MEVNTFTKQLLAMRAQAIATVAAIDAVLAQFEEQAKASTSPPEEEPPPSDGECVHPPHLRTPAPTMGHPSRFVCRQCNTMQEG